MSELSDATTRDLLNDYKRFSHLREVRIPYVKELLTRVDEKGKLYTNEKLEEIKKRSMIVYKLGRELKGIYKKREDAREEDLEELEIPSQREIDECKIEEELKKHEKNTKIILLIISLIIGGGIITGIVFLSIYLYKKFRSKKNKTPS